MKPTKQLLSAAQFPASLGKAADCFESESGRRGGDNCTNYVVTIRL